MKTWMKVVGGLLVLGIIGQALAPSAPTEQRADAADGGANGTPDPARERSDRSIIRESEARLLSRLKDAESAKFSDVLVVRSSGKPVVCGYVNSKNGFGGYTGKRAFVAPDGGTPISEEDLDQKNFAILWNASCTLKTDSAPVR